MVANMMGGLGGGNAGLFGSPSPSEGEKDYGDIFEGDMGDEEGAGDPLMTAIEGAGYSVTPDKLEQIKSILEGGSEEEGGMAPEGIEPTETGPEITKSAP